MLEMPLSGQVSQKLERHLADGLIVIRSLPGQESTPEPLESLRQLCRRVHLAEHCSRCRRQCETEIFSDIGDQSDRTFHLGSPAGMEPMQKSSTWPYNYMFLPNYVL